MHAISVQQKSEALHNYFFIIYILTAHSKLRTQTPSVYPKFHLFEIPHYFA